MTACRRFALVVAVAMSVLAATGAAASAATMPAGKWARTVCVDLERWQQAMLLREARATPPTDAASTKAAFVEFYGAAAGDTKNLIADLRRAGTPNVASGTKIAKKLVAGASAARVVFKRAVASAKNLPTSDKAAFLLAVGKLQQQLQRATDPILAALQAGGSVSSAALDRAFAGQPQCQVFVGHQPGP